MTAALAPRPDRRLDFWWVLVTSPEVLVFLFFMITDPRTIPETGRGRRVYAIVVGLVATLLDRAVDDRVRGEARDARRADDRLRCTARPAARARRDAAGPLSRSGCGSRPRSPARRAGALGARGVGPSSPRVSCRDRAAGTRRARHPRAFPLVTVARGVASPHRRRDGAAGSRPRSSPTSGCGGPLRLRDRLRAWRAAHGRMARRPRRGSRPAGPGTIDVPTYDAEHVRLRLEPGKGQGPPLVVATLSGSRDYTYDRSRRRSCGATRPGRFVRTFELAPTTVATSCRRPRRRRRARPGQTASVPAAFRLTRRRSERRPRLPPGRLPLRDVSDPAAMMGGGLCGSTTTTTAGSTSTSSTPTRRPTCALERSRRPPESRLYHNVHGRSWTSPRDPHRPHDAGSGASPLTSTATARPTYS